MSYLTLKKTIIEKNGRGFVQFNLVDTPAIPESSLQPDQIVIKILSAPINPSDIGPLFSPSHGGIGKFDGAEVSVDSNGRPITMLPIPGSYSSSLVGRAIRVGNEGAGRVIAAGKSHFAQSLKGKLVAYVGGGSYAQCVVVKAGSVLVHHDSTTPEEAASSFVNPFTALGMVKTMHAEKHTGIVHTAAASQLGQMLVKICLKDNIPLVNIVRSEHSVVLLKSIGAKHVLNTSAKTFQQDLLHALKESNATIAFDALGGGDLGFKILKGMEKAASSKGGPRNNYGSSTFKKLYIYGGLNAGQPLLLRPHAGMGGFSWGVQGFLMGVGAATITESDKKRVAQNIKTTFATKYAHMLTLESMLNPKRMKEYQTQKSNSKALVCPFGVTEALISPASRL